MSPSRRDSSLMSRAAKLYRATAVLTTLGVNTVQGQQHPKISACKLMIYWHFMSAWLMLVIMNVWRTNEMMMKTQPGRHIEGKMKGWMWRGIGEGGMDDARAQTSKKRSTWPEGSRALRGEVQALRTEEGEVVGSTGGCWDSMGGERQTDIQKVRESANKRGRAQQNYWEKKPF